ncbi:C1q-binding complement inhibitor VraX [Staphylococcus aureus]
MGYDYLSEYNHHEGAPVYEIITKTFQHVSIKCDDSFSDTEIFKLLSLLQDDINHMKVS